MLWLCYLQLQEWLNLRELPLKQSGDGYLWENWKESEHEGHFRIDGKTMLDVNEAYTSKTMSWCGKIKKNLGGSKTISDGFIKVDRDVNGARNIMLRALTVA